MAGHTTHLPHGSGVRGLSTFLATNGHEGRFGRLFPGLIAATFSEDALAQLAGKIIADKEELTEGVDPEESHIPSAYTYFGQFVDHDLTFDPSTFDQQKSDPTGIIDFRSPRFDLDNVYGRGPGDQPYLYDRIDLMQGETPLTGASRNPNARDLQRAQRNSDGDRRAIIGDPRNDENAIVSQMQGMMYRFHRQVRVALGSSDFDAIRQEVVWHYQWIVLHDFLTRLVTHSVLNDISEAILDTSKSFASYPPRLQFFDFAESVMPVEFSVAAYRMGHSMVRPGYRVNENIPPLPIFDAANPKAGLNAFGEFNATWCIDWQRFIDLGFPQPATANPDQDRVQMAYKIDTSMVDPLGHLPHSVAGDEGDIDPRKQSLAFRNLLRGLLLQLPNGQAVARQMGHKPLHDSEILIGKAAKDETTIPIVDIHPEFKENCPLWTYVLAESRHNWVKTGEARLGAVGGRIVAETFVGLLLCDPNSFLNVNPNWRPQFAVNGKFTLAELLSQALKSPRLDSPPAVALIGIGG